MLCFVLKIPFLIFIIYFIHLPVYIVPILVTKTLTQWLIVRAHSYKYRYISQIENHFELGSHFGCDLAM